ncbi:MAG: AAA family ATPase [Verrucomicrobia bacterium]|nr:AAA family ATPase [Verrucomicrobiota bacterium]
MTAEYIARHFTTLGTPATISTATMRQFYHYRLSCLIRNGAIIKVALREDGVWHGGFCKREAVMKRGASGGTGWHLGCHPGRAASSTDDSCRSPPVRGRHPGLHRNQEIFVQLVLFRMTAAGLSKQLESPTLESMIKIVVTGGPGSGKTAVLEELQRRGFTIVPEAALHLIETEEKAGGNILPWTCLQTFNERLIALQIQWEQAIPKDCPLALLDRSLIDPIAYLENGNLDVPSTLKKEIKRARYTQAFLLEMLPRKYWNHTTSGRPRKSPYAEAVKIHSVLQQTYANIGIPVEPIPFLPVEKRADLMEEKMETQYGHVH